MCEEPIITHLLHIQSYEFHTIIDSIQTLHQSQSEWIEYNHTFPWLEICSYDRLQEWSIVTGNRNCDYLWNESDLCWLSIPSFNKYLFLSLHHLSEPFYHTIHLPYCTLGTQKWIWSSIISLDTHFYLEWIDQDYQSLNYELSFKNTWTTQLFHTSKWFFHINTIFLRYICITYNHQSYYLFSLFWHYLNRIHRIYFV